MIWAKEMAGLWSACRKFDDELCQITVWEWENSVCWVGCNNDREAAHELAGTTHPTKVTDLSNQYRRVCAQLGTQVLWQHTSIQQQSTTSGNKTLMSETRAAREDTAAMAESSMWDRTPVGLRLCRALKVLTHHCLFTVRSITLPNGRWMPFGDLPLPRWEKGWSRQDYHALCTSITATLPLGERVWSEDMCKQGQQTLVGEMAGHRKLQQIAQVEATPHRVVADKFPRIAGVSDHLASASSYLCHFRPPQHHKDALFPEQWRDDWELAAFLVKAAATLTIRMGEPTRKCAAECSEVFRDEQGEVHVTMRAGQEDVSLPVSGYRGVRAYLPPSPLSETATRPAERIFETECTAVQWAVVQRHCATLEHARERQRTGEVLTHVGDGCRAAGAQPATRSGQQVMRAYGSVRPPLPFPTVGRKRVVQQESPMEWSYHHRPETVGDIVFDTSMMVPSPMCVPQGTWTATARHGQAMLQQHPLNWRGSRLKPTANDITIDSAQLTVLLQQGVSLADVADACTRQSELARGGWAKVLTTALCIATAATTWWGATSLTWDPHFPHYVSPSPEDVSMGAYTATQALPRVGEDTIIDLDASPELTQQRIIRQLRHSNSTLWVLFTARTRKAGGCRQMLSKIGTQVDTLLAGQMGGARSEEGQEGWRTGDTRVGALAEGCSVWVGGTGAHINDELWEEAWNLEHKHAPQYHLLSPTGRAYWQHRQDGAYVEWKGTLAACDRSAGGGMGAAAVLKDTAGQVSTRVCKVGRTSSSFRAEAAAMWQAIDEADKV